MLQTARTHHRRYDWNYRNVSFPKALSRRTAKKGELSKSVALGPRARTALTVRAAWCGATHCTVSETWKVDFEQGDTVGSEFPAEFKPQACVVFFETER